MILLDFVKTHKDTLRGTELNSTVGFSNREGYCKLPNLSSTDIQDRLMIEYCCMYG